MTARMARQYLTWRSLPRCWAVLSWRATALRYEGDMVKRIQHIGTFLHNERGISLRGMSPMCSRSSIHLQKIFFLRSIETRCTTERAQIGNSPPKAARVVFLPDNRMRRAMWRELETE